MKSRSSSNNYLLDYIPLNSRSRIVIGIVYVLLGLTLSSQKVFSQVAETPIFGGSPGINPVPGFVNPPAVSIGNVNSCPISSFNISAYGARGNDYANGGFSFDSSDRNVNNYGLAFTFSVPLERQSLRDFCRDIAKSRGSFEVTRTENQLINSQIALLRQCFWLQETGLLNTANFESWEGNENFSALTSCFEITLNQNNEAIENDVTPLNIRPPESNTEASDPPGGNILQTLD